MSTFVAQTPAKVNLHLEVLRRREDGYHEIETIFQALELADTVTVKVHDKKGPIHVSCVHPGVPLDRTNLCHRAAKLLRSRTGDERAIDIHIEKRIPVAAGLGGGSSNAAGVLLALERAYRLDLDPGVLAEHAVKLGADVPFFLRGGTAIGRGIGEQLTTVSSSGNGTFLVLTPPQEISTAWVYEQLRMGLTRSTPKVNLQTIKALLSRFPERQWSGFNRLGDVVFPSHSRLHRLYLALLETRPYFAMLSGSGPSVFAVYESVEAAEGAAREVDSAADTADMFRWIGRSSRHGVTIREETEAR